MSVAPVYQRLFLGFKRQSLAGSGRFVTVADGFRDILAVNITADNTGHFVWRVTARGQSPPAAIASAAQRNDDFGRSIRSPRLPDCLPAPSNFASAHKTNRPPPPRGSVLARLCKV